MKRVRPTQNNTIELVVASSEFTSKLSAMPKIALSRDLLAETGIPKKFWAYDLREFSGSDSAVRACVWYIKKAKVACQNGVHLFLAGPVNSGKTFLGTFVLKCVLVKGFTVKYTTLVDISRDYVGDGETKHSLRKLYLDSADFLFIDDVVIDPNKAEKNGLERVLKLRLTAGLPTIMASRESGSEVMLSFGASFHSFVGLTHEVSTASDTADFAVDHAAKFNRSKIWGSLDHAG